MAPVHEIGVFAEAAEGLAEAQMASMREIAVFADVQVASRPENSEARELREAPTRTQICVCVCVCVCVYIYIYVKGVMALCTASAVPATDTHMRGRTTPRSASWPSRRST